MSPQPIFGGPVYFFRNVVYNGVYGPLKIHGNPSGILVFQNTYVGEIAMLSPASNMHFRNNLILGQGTRPAVLADRYVHELQHIRLQRLQAQPGFGGRVPVEFTVA